MNQNDQKYDGAEPFHGQDPFTDAPSAGGSSFNGSLQGDPFSQGPASREQEPVSREDPASGVPGMPGAAEEDMPVEEAFARLEELIRRMESEDISLEDSFACYEQGIRLVRYCNEKIDRVEKKVQILRGEGFSQSVPESMEG